MFPTDRRRKNDRQNRKNARRKNRYDSRYKRKRKKKDHAKIKLQEFSKCLSLSRMQFHRYCIILCAMTGISFLKKLFTFFQLASK